MMAIARNIKEQSENLYEEWQITVVTDVTDTVSLGSENGKDNVFNVNKVCNVCTQNEGKNGVNFTGKSMCKGQNTLLYIFTNITLFLQTSLQLKKFFSL